MTTLASIDGALGIAPQEVLLASGAHELVRAADGCSMMVVSEWPARVTLDGQALPVFRDDRRVRAAATMNADLVMGARRVQVIGAGGTATMDVLLTPTEELIRRLEPALNVVQTSLPRLRGPFRYLDTTGRPRASSDFVRLATYLNDHGDALVSALGEVISEPRRAATLRTRARPTGHPIDPAATRALLMRRPELLQRDTVEGDDGRQAVLRPAMVAVRERATTLDTPPHRSLAAFARRLVMDCSAGLLGPSKSDVKDILRHRVQELAGLLASTFLAEIPSSPEDLLAEGSAQTDDRLGAYQVLERLRLGYVSEVVPVLGEPVLERQHLPRADEVFQAYCMVLIAEALDLVRSPSSKSGWPVEYDGPEWVAYSEALGVLNSWRRDTTRPDDYRPDVVLVSKSDSSVVLLDAKFASSPLGVPGERIKEVQAYMQTYGMKSAGILFPGDGNTPNDITARGMLIREIPIQTDIADVASASEALRAHIAGLESWPEWGLAED